MSKKITKSEGAKFHGTWFIKKFTSDADFQAGNAYEDKCIGENLLLNEGINEMWTILASASSGTKFDNTNAYIGVGDDDTAADPAQTGLLAVTNKDYVAMDGSYPTYGTSQKATYRATFTGLVANYAWKEFTVANGNSNSAKNMNRLVSNQGTKTSGQTWQVSVEITLS